MSSPNNSKSGFFRLKLFFDNEISLVPILISGYPDGAPEDGYHACQTLIPGHGFEPQPVETNPVAAQLSGISKV